ncbi:L,D-transpeptidase family protein [Enterobacter sp. E1]|nr:L,D-transpeptidase family protein [Enterobacter sp. E1]
MRHAISRSGSYPISLGRNADAGPKQREGDKKTPQGHYYIDSRNTHSRFSLSLHISYPDKTDIQQAKENSYPPGENIMIHGVPNGWGCSVHCFDTLTGPMAAFRRQTTICEKSGKRYQSAHRLRLSNNEDAGSRLILRNPVPDNTNCLCWRKAFSQ